jgi:hypothetical protein
VRLTLVVLLLVSVTVSAASHAQAVSQPTEPLGFYGLDPKWLIGQAGLLIALLVLLRLLSNRERDTREQTRELQQVLKDVAAANTAHALSVARNTDAMKANTRSNDRLAQEVRILSERRAGTREAPADGDPT